MRVLAAFLLALSLLALGQPALCTTCLQDLCYGTCAQLGCVCMTPPGGSSGGSCWGQGYREALLRMGYREAR